MFKIFKTLILIIWIIDILDINFLSNKIHVAEFLDKIIQYFVRKLFIISILYSSNHDIV